MSISGPPRYSCFDIVMLILIIFVIVSAGIILIAIWLIVRGNEVKFYATNATLTTFNLTNNNTMTSKLNLAVNLRAVNPNPRSSICYDDIVVSAIYQGLNLKTIQAVAVCHSRRHNNNNKNTSTSSQPLVLASYSTNGELDRCSNNSSGVYEMEMKIHFWVRFELGFFKIGTWKAAVHCHRNLPFAANSSHTFQATKCDYNYL